MANLSAKQLDQQSIRVVPPHPSGGFMRSSGKFLLSAILGVTLIGCATDSAIGPDETLRPSFAVTFDSQTGIGFVGKGDVQYTFNWNNKQLQDNAGLVAFQVASEEVTEVSWICTNSNNENTQERERTTTTSVQGVLSSIGRERNQITGFLLTGYDGAPVIGPSETEGPPVNSCPSGPWSLTTPAGEPEVVSSMGGFQVSGDGGTTWTALLIKP